MNPLLDSSQPSHTQRAIPQCDAAVLQEQATDCELLAIFVAERDCESIEQLVRRHAPMVASVVRRMLHHPSDAEDAFQATFLVLLQSASKIRHQASLSAWLYGVAYRTAYRVRQQSRVYQALDRPEAIQETQSLDNPLDKLSSECQLEQLDRELNRLQANLREVLVEHHLLGFTAPQIADRLNLSVAAVEGRLRRGRALLRQRLARRGISLTVSVAIAAVYQQGATASTGDWIEQLIASESFTSSIETGGTSNVPYLQRLVQGELAMKSAFIKGTALAVAIASLTTGIGALPFLVASNESKSQSVVAVSLGSESTASTDESFVATNPFNAPSTPKADLQEPANSVLANPNDGSKNTASVAGSVPPKPIKRFTKPTGPLPHWMTDGGTIAQEENQARDQIRKLMRMKMRPDFNNTPLRSVMEMFSSTAEVPILIDTIALEGAGGATPEDPVSLTGIPEISLQRALKIILDPKELCYSVEADHILITTKDNGGVRFSRFYDLAHFLPSDEKAEDLMNLIQDTISASWEIDGGEDTLRVFGSMLVASCPEDAHVAIEGLLFELSKTNKDNL